eukprot:1161716-Pelagomonas_calceolata.AAC.13
MDVLFRMEKEGPLVLCNHCKRDTLMKAPATERVRDTLRQSSDPGACSQSGCVLLPGFKYSGAGAEGEQEKVEEEEQEDVSILDLLANTVLSLRRRQQFSILDPLAINILSLDSDGRTVLFVAQWQQGASCAAVTEAPTLPVCKFALVSPGWGMRIIMKRTRAPGTQGPSSIEDIKLNAHHGPRLCRAIVPPNHNCSRGHCPTCLLDLTEIAHGHCPTCLLDSDYPGFEDVELFASHDTIVHRVAVLQSLLDFDCVYCYLGVCARNHPQHVIAEAGSTTA